MQIGPAVPARDEYDSYAPHILSLLYAGSALMALADHLEKLRMVDMGLPRQRERDEEAARELTALQLASPRS